MLEEKQMRLVVQTAYDALERYAAASGSDMSLDVKYLKTILPLDFESVKWTSLVDMPDGLLVDVTREMRRLETPGIEPGFVERVVYAPSWRSQEKEWLKAPWGKSLLGLSASQVLAQAGSEYSVLRAVKAISSLEVTVTMAGQSRTYRAAFLWIPAAGATDGKTSFAVVDHIVQNVEGAVREAVPALRPDAKRKLFRVPRLGELSRPKNLEDDGATCQPSTQNYQQSGNASSPSDHISGVHSSTATFYQTCTCQSDCTQTCSVSISGTSCTDTGTPSSACHVVSSGQSNSTGISFGAGHTSPAECAAGFGCVQKACLFCLCGLSVGVSASGPSVTFSPGGSPDWSGNHPFSRACTPCQTTTPPPPPPPGGGGGDDGGGDGGTCDMDRDGWVTEDECYMDCGGWSDGEYCWVG